MAWLATLRGVRHPASRISASCRSIGRGYTSQRRPSFAASWADCFDAITRTLVRRHMKQRHPSLEVPEDFQTATKPTSGYIDPLDVKMPMVTVPLGAVRRRRRAAEARQGNANILEDDFLRVAHPDKEVSRDEEFEDGVKRRKRNWRLSDEDTLSVPVSFPSVEEDFALSMELMRGADDDTLDLS